MEQELGQTARASWCVTWSSSVFSLPELDAPVVRASRSYLCTGFLEKAPLPPDLLSPLSVAFY